MLHRLQQNLMGEERAALDQLVDTGNVHLDNASGADIEMPDFAAAHLPLGQADERAVGADQRVRIVLPQPIEVGLARHLDGVVLRVRIMSPTIHDGEDKGPGTFHDECTSVAVPLWQEGLLPTENGPQRHARRPAAGEGIWGQRPARASAPRDRLPAKRLAAFSHHAERRSA